MTSFQAIDIHTRESDQWLLQKKEVFGCDSCLPSVILKIIGLVNDVIFRFEKYFYNFIHPRKYSDEIVEEGDGSKKALVVLLHGLNAKPANMGFPRRFLERRHGEGLAYLQPHIVKKGNCSLDDAAERIHQQVLTWAEGNAGKPIFFAGVSNGARISAQIASKLMTVDGINNPIKVHAAAGPFYGSRTVNPPFHPTVLKVWQWALKSPLFKKISKEFIEETSWGSERGKQLINEMRAGAESGVEFSFYSSRGDNVVRSTCSAFPKGIKQASYRMFSYQGHSSITKAITPYLVASIA